MTSKRHANFRIIHLIFIFKIKIMINFCYQEFCSLKWDYSFKYTRRLEEFLRRNMNVFKNIFLLKLCYANLVVKKRMFSTRKQLWAVANCILYVFNVFWNTINVKLMAVVGSVQLISNINLGHQMLASSQICQENLQISMVV